MSHLQRLSESLVGLIGESYHRKEESLGEEPQTHSWIVKILDDLARILVCKDGETVAVGMQPDLGPNGGRIILTVASSGSAEPEAKADHLYDVLTRMQEIGFRFRKYKRETVMDDDELPSEKDLPDELQHELAGFRQCVYEFCVVKIWQLLQRDYTAKARAYLQQLLRDEDSDMLDGVEGVLQFLNGCYFLLNQNKFSLDKMSGYHLETLAMGMTHGYRHSSKMFEQDAWESQLRRNLVGDGRVFPFEWFITHITAIAYSTERLIKFALSKKCYYRYLDPARRALSVKCLHSEGKQQIVNLASEESMQTISHTILRELSPDVLNNPAIDSITPWTTLAEHHPKCPLPAPVHPECRLALHFIRENRKQAFHAFSYIGTSTSSTCFACWKFIGVLRSLSGITLKMRGTHGRAIFPWKFPTSELRESGLAETVQERITGAFCTELTCAFARRFVGCVENPVPPRMVASGSRIHADSDEEEFELAVAKLRVEETRRARWCAFALGNDGEDEDEDDDDEDTDSECESEDEEDLDSPVKLKARLEMPVLGRGKWKVWRGRKVYSRHTCRTTYMRVEIEGWARRGEVLVRVV